jgi:hypothetical protein
MADYGGMNDLRCSKNRATLKQKKPSSNQQAENVYRIIGNSPLDIVLSTFFIDFDFG